MDNAYPIEIRIASKNGWFTAAEAKAYYGKFDRSGVCIHWWGDGTGAANHDNIVNYLLDQASKGVKSANYVVSDNKITLVVNPDSAAWCQESGNAVEVSFECQPTLGDEGYKKAGWLKWQLEQRYNRQLEIHGHNHWWQTTCPGSLDLNRVEAECRKWASGGYNPQPNPTPPTSPQKANLEWIKFDRAIDYVCNLQPTKLWNFDQISWSAFGAAIKQFNKGEPFTAYARVINHTLNAEYLVTQYSYDKRIPNGVNEKDLTLKEQPLPPVVPPPTVPAADNKWLVLSLQSLVDDLQTIITKLKG
jgi:hypothetical protein